MVVNKIALLACGVCVREGEGGRCVWGDPVRVGGGGRKEKEGRGREDEYQWR